MENKDAAFILFKEGVLQKDIAAILSIAEKTVSSWATKDNWEKKRTEDTLQKQNAEKMVWQLINYQLSVLNEIRELNESDTEGAKIKEPKDKLIFLKAKLIDKGELDGLQKLFTTVKGKEMEWTQRVKVIKEFTEYIEDQDMNLAKEVLPLANEYLNHKRKEM